MRKIAKMSATVCELLNRERSSIIMIPNTNVSATQTHLQQHSAYSEEPGC